MREQHFRPLRNLPLPHVPDREVLEGEAAAVRRPRRPKDRQIAPAHRHFGAGVAQVRDTAPSEIRERGAGLLELPPGILAHERRVQDPVVVAGDDELVRVREAVQPVQLRLDLGEGAVVGEVAGV